MNDHRIINFFISVNSYWPEKQFPNQIVFPAGGTFEHKRIEFDVEDVKDSMTKAEEVLRETMKDVPYHIWTWTWIQ